MSSSDATGQRVRRRRLLGVIQADGDGYNLVQEGDGMSLEPAAASEGGARGESPTASVNEERAAIGPRELLADREGPIGEAPVHGAGVFDFRYGPFAGGFPEAGVFHLSTYGERILSCRIDSSYKHRGIEASMAGCLPDEGLRWAEAVCGNFAFAHSLAYCRAVEGALGIEVTGTDRRLRLIGLEMERIYNHLLVIARLAQAAAQKVLDAHLSALFEEALRLNRLFAGSRLLAGVNRIGGVSPMIAAGGAWAQRGPADGRAADTRPPDGPRALERLAGGVEVLRTRFERLYETSLSNRNYLDRLHLIGVAGAERALATGLTGPSLRAASDPTDLRNAEELLPGFAPITKAEGDSLARMEVRAEEILQSCDIVRSQIASLLEGGSTGSGAGASDRGLPSPAAGAREGRSEVRAKALQAKALRAAEGGSGIGAAESPSGTIAWWVDLSEGRIRRAYASTPSLFGFRAFAEVIASHIFTDFPFALESFGLSFADAAR